MDEVHPPAYLGHLRAQAVTAAEALRAAGYRTAMSGKWHLSHLHITGKDQLNFRSLEPFWDTKESWPVARGFDEFYGTIAGVNNFFDPFSLVHNETLTKPESEDYYYTDAINDHAVRMIDRWAAAGEPFFLYVAHAAPHWPLHALPEDIERYRGVYDSGWDAMRVARYQRLVAAGVIDPKWPLTPRDRTIPAWRDAPHQGWQARRMAVHAAMVDRMDQGIGRILKALDRHGAAQHTIVMFLSDNGASPEVALPQWYDIPSQTRDGRPLPVTNDPAIMPGAEDTWSTFGREWANASNTPFRLYKHWIHEGGIATPFIVRWPSVVQPGGMTHQVAHIIDVLPTLLEAVGIAHPQTKNGEPTLALDGKSLMPVLRGARREGHEVLGWEHEGNEALRQDQWKLVRARGGEWELYDMEADRTELNNLAASERHRVRQLEARHRAWMEHTGALPWPEYVRIRGQRAGQAAK
jgi:arylsulfatase